jgi:hypothetical protein
MTTPSTYRTFAIKNIAGTWMLEIIYYSKYDNWVCGSQYLKFDSIEECNSALLMAKFSE